MTAPTCRHCRTPLTEPILDLGHAPPSNAYLRAQDLSRPEKHFPLRIRICPGCLLVQTEDFTCADELFDSDYAYFSSTSTGWLRHAAEYVAMITARLELGPQSQVIEIASNDGYLLRNFVSRAIPCLGIEPTASTAGAARKFGIPTLERFFGAELGAELAAQGQAADLLIGNNVYAHVPDINDVTRGMAIVLKPQGVITLEFPHLMRLIEFNQFDTIYHEHFSYFSLLSVVRIFEAHGLRIFDVEELPTHGGSLRIFGCHADAGHADTGAVAGLLAVEAQRGLDRVASYETLQARAEAARNDLLRFLLDAHAAGQSVAAYGAAAKGNTILNFAGIRPDLLPYVCDAAPSKQGKFMPGSHIPIVAPEALRANRPDYVLILPWNIAAEVREQLADLAAAGTRFVTAIPELRIL
ncbi:MAG: methyltransferase domain-containing protein [Tropicimonas sp.]|uniref:methyltransferase domain-containing protein n=1 Tax=Tropicimonas sp. TaxID=2067044 RepID=UPI003A8B60E6